jgi:hypothetical protein
MGNHQQNQQPRHEQKHREGQRLGDNNQGGKADQHETVFDQGGQGGRRDQTAPEPRGDEEE